jgi:polysaccharide pyruvyl transferase WcaK-like protein
MDRHAPMTIEIHGTGTHNRGAQLMAIAIADRLTNAFPECRLVVPQMFGNYKSRAQYGFWTTNEESYRFRSDSLYPILQYGPDSLLFAARLVDQSVSRLLEPNHQARQALGLARPNEIDAVLDASGFAFSDQWGATAARRLVTKMKLRRSDKPLVLMPQAFGPFEYAKTGRWTRRLFDTADLIFARDDASYNACLGLVEDKGKLFKAPDFTLTVKPLSDCHMTLPSQFTAIVPNRRMIDKREGQMNYLPLLHNVYQRLEQLDLNPLFVIHDSKEDLTVLADLKRIGLRFRTLTSGDPRVLKWILGKATFVVASRFHALVSSLSQGIPCIGLGWSHKYPQLFHDFECSQFMLENLDHNRHLNEMLEVLANDDQRSALALQLTKRSHALKVDVEQMWKKIEELLSQRTNPDNHLETNWNESKLASSCFQGGSDQ